MKNAADGAANKLHLTIPKEWGSDLRQTITSDYSSRGVTVLESVLPEGTLGAPGEWQPSWIQLDYTSPNVMCIEKLTVSNPDEPSVSYNIVQDYDPTAWDVVASNPGWTSSTNAKIVHFADSCYYDATRQITQVIS